MWKKLSTKTKITDFICRRLFLDLLFYSTDLYVSIFMPVPHCFDYYNFAVSFEIMKCRSDKLSIFFVLFQDLFIYLFFEELFVGQG